uniref:Uncharacterized protein n=1 Tax=viral metagenome TaxID=1070528 RepID=A0A6M3LNL7_9ZZZZ
MRVERRGGKGMTEIGKLENGEIDPCYHCKNSDSEVCQTCQDYDKAKS